MLDFSIYFNHVVGFFIVLSYLLFVKWFLMTFIFITKITSFLTPSLFLGLRNLALRVEYMDTVSRDLSGKLFNYTRSKLLLVEDYVDSEELIISPCYSPTSTDLMLFKTVRLGLNKVKPSLYNVEFKLKNKKKKEEPQKKRGRKKKS